MWDFYRKVLPVFFCCLFLDESLCAEEIRIDHVTVAVSNIDDASNSYKNMGFTIKPGRIHNNGLLNAHIKMLGNTAIELMSLVGIAKDEASRKYDEVLRAGEGGAYLALTGMSPEKFSALVGEVPFRHEIIKGKLWDYVIFPEGSGLEHIYLYSPNREFRDQAWVYNHPNEAKKIDKVWLEGGEKVEKLLEVLGAQYLGEITNHLGSTGKSYYTSTGNIVVVQGDSGRRPRILGLSIEMTSEKDSILIDSDRAHGIWIDSLDGESVE